MFETSFMAGFSITFPVVVVECKWDLCLMLGNIPETKNSIQ